MTEQKPDIQALIAEAQLEARHVEDSIIRKLMFELAEALSALSDKTETAMTGQIVTASIEDGNDFVCGLEDCECPDHESAPPAGVYITVRLDDENLPIGLWRVAVTREAIA